MVHSCEAGGGFWGMPGRALNSEDQAGIRGQLSAGLVVPGYPSVFSRSAADCSSRAMREPRDSEAAADRADSPGITGQV